jgi:thiosulfate/3-mercaptopyruvate sulfurtransferase
MLRRSFSLLSTTHSLKTMTSRVALSTAAGARSPLLSTDELETLLAQHKDKVKLVDGSWYLDKNRNGRQEFAQERLPDARFFDIAEISDKTSTLPHMLPTGSLYHYIMG